MFTQKISMDCTQEQYEKYLKAELEKMGYRFYLEFCDFSFPTITNCYNNSNGVVNELTIEGRKAFGRTYLGKFNADLFLALAAMTDDEFGGIGEYWKYIGEESHNWTPGKLYKANGSIEELCPFIDDTGDSNGIVYPLRSFQKAIVKELQEYLGLCNTSMDIISNWNTATMKRSGPILPAITPPIIVPYQLCPKCKGEGDLPAFSDPFGHTTNSISSQRKPCDVCFGNKIIPMHVIKQN